VASHITTCIACRFCHWRSGRRSEAELTSHRHWPLSGPGSTVIGMEPVPVAVDEQLPEPIYSCKLCRVCRACRTGLLYQRQERAPVSPALLLVPSLRAQKRCVGGVGAVVALRGESSRRVGAELTRSNVHA